MVQTTRNFDFFDKKPGVLKNIFDKPLTLFWKTFLWLKQLSDAELLILSVFQKYGSPTRATRLKVAPKMADPISFRLKTVALSTM